MSQNESSRHPIFVLLVDDEPDQLKMTQLGLQSENNDLTIKTASSARQALEQTHAQPFDCIVSDYVMPNMNGLELCAKLKAEGNNTPFILFTGQGSEEVAQKAFSVGVDDYLRKEQSLAIYSVLARNIRNLVDKHRADESLLSSQRTFSELVERAPFGIYVIDSQFRIAEMNRDSQDGAFRNVRPIIGRPFSDAMHILWPDEVAEEILSHFRRTLETGEPYYSPKFTNPRQDLDTVESYEWELHRMTLPDGQHGVVCYYYDSTKIRDAEASLRESEERHRSLFHNMLDGYAYCQMIYDEDDNPADFVYIDVNDSFERLTGLRVEQVVGRRVTEAIPGIREANPELIEAYGRVSSTGVPERFELFFKPLGIWLSIAVYSPKKGYFVAVFDNITDRKNAENELRAAKEELRGYANKLESMVNERTSQLRTTEERLRRFMEASTDSTVIYDKDLVLKDLNEAAMRVFFPDMRREDVVNRSLLQLAPGIEKTERYNRYRNVIEKGEPYTGTVQLSVPLLGLRIFEQRVFRVGEGLGAIARDITDAVQAEISLGESKERLESFMDSASEGFAIYDGDLNLVDANRVVVDRFPKGTKKEDIVGRNIAELYPGIEDTEYYKFYLRVLETGVHWHAEDVHGVSHLRGLVFDVSAFKVGDGLGVISRDITERRRLDDELRRISLYTRNLIEASLDPLVTISPEGVIMDVNKATENATGYPRGQLVGSDFSYYFTEPEKARAGYLKAFNEGSVRDYHLALRRRDGEVTEVLYNASVFRDEAGGVQGVFAAARDVTVQRRLEERLRKFIDSAKDGFSIYDSDLRLIDVNKAWLERLPEGMTKGDVLGKHMTEVYPGVEKTPRYNEYLRVRETGIPYNYEGYLAGEIVKRRYYSASVFKVGDGIGIVSRDFTEQRVLEEKLRRVSQVDTVSRIGATVAHDLRGPLNAIAQSLEMAEKQPDVSTKMVASARKSTAKALGMLEEFRSGTREVKVVKRNVDISTLVVDAVEGVPKKSKVKIDVKVDESLGYVALDPDIMNRVFDNLIRNALDAMPEGGRATISVKPMGDEALIEVRDTGSGIKPEDAGHLFEPLFTTKSGGMGLGLYFVRTAVEAHGGSISFESKVGVGTTFRINLPLT